MARIVKEEEYTARRKEILDAAQRLLMTKGYEQMAIQDLVLELGISKGAFYHYFDTKQALLEALVDRIQEEISPLLQSIVDDPDLPAIEKLRRIFHVSARWKAARKEYLMGILRVWYHDDNALFRQKVYANGLKWMSPILAQVIRQGIREGTLYAPYPDQVGEIIFSLFQGMGDSIAAAILTPEPRRDDLQRIENLVMAYNHSLERILGASSGSLALIEPEMLREWIPSLEGVQGEIV